MPEGVVPSRGFNDQLVRVVRQVLREERGATRGRTRHHPVAMPWYWAVSNEAIGSASNGLTTPGTGEVEFLKTTYGTGAPVRERSGQTETASNRSEHVSIVEDTLLMVAYHRGELVVLWADCDALAVPPPALAFTVSVTTTLTLPIVADIANNFTVDWGDGAGPQGPYADSHLPLTRDYTADGPAPGAGSYTVEIDGKCPRFRFNDSGDKGLVTAVSSIDAAALGMTNASGMWYGCFNLASVAGIANFAGVTNVQEMFRECTVLDPVPDLTEMTGVTTAHQMFWDATGMTGTADLSGFTALVTATEMFRGCSSLTGVPSLTALTSVTDASQMFVNCSGMTGTPDVSPMTALTNADLMFDGCSSMSGTPTLSGLTAVTNGSEMFRNCGGLTGTIDLSAFTSMTDATEMFRNCSGITGLTPGTVDACTDWDDSFTGTNIAAAGIDAWLIAIDATGLTGGFYDYANMPNNAHLDSARSGAASTAITNLGTKSWTRNGTY